MILNTLGDLDLILIDHRQAQTAPLLPPDRSTPLWTGPQPPQLLVDPRFEVITPATIAEEPSPTLEVPPTVAKVETDLLETMAIETDKVKAFKALDN